MAEKITFFESYWQAIKLLPEEEQGKFVCKIMAYVFDGVEPVLEGAQAIAFTLIKPNIDASLKRASVNAENGRNGGRPKGEKPTEKQSGKPNETDGFSNHKTEAKTDGFSHKKTEAKTDTKTEPYPDKDKDKEGNNFLPLEEENYSSYSTDVAVCGGTAPPVERTCPICESVMRRTSSKVPGTDRHYWRCDFCGEEVCE